MQSDITRHTTVNDPTRVLSKFSLSCTAFNEILSQSYGMSLAIWHHVPPDTSEHTPLAP